VVEHNGHKIFLRDGRYALPDATYVYKNAIYDLTDRLVTISTANDTPLMSNDKIRLQIEAQLLFTVVDEADKTADTLRAEGLRQYDNIKPENLGYNQAIVTATGNATRDLLKGAHVNMVGKDAQGLGAMLMNGRASTRPNLEADVIFPTTNRPSQTVS
jgi:hypothetical protein